MEGNLTYLSLMEASRTFTCLEQNPLLFCGHDNKLLLQLDLRLKGCGDKVTTNITYLE